MMMVVVLALAGALFVAVGFVIQQHAAAEEPADERLSFRLLLRLLHRPLWLAGIGAMVVGQLLGAVALGRGSIALVEPVLAANLLFALPLSALWHRRHLGAREWVGAFALIGGLASFIVAGNPHGGQTLDVGSVNWVIMGGTIGALAAGLVSASQRRPPARQATMLAAAAGLLYGLQDALTQRTLAGLKVGVVHLLTTWPAWLLLAVAVVGLLLAQSAFEAAPLAASLPAITVAEPMTGIAIGVGVYGSHLDLQWPLLVAEIGSFAVAVVGVFLVARSPLVTGETSRHKTKVRRPDEGGSADVSQVA